MNNESEQHGVSLVGVHELVVMRFLAKMEVRRDRMLEEVDDEIAQQHKKRRRPSAQLEAFWNHLDQGCGQHESRAQRDKVAQIAPLPVPLHNDRATEDVGGGRGEAEKDAGNDGMHS